MTLYGSQGFSASRRLSSELAGDAASSWGRYARGAGGGGGLTGVGHQPYVTQAQYFALGAAAYPNRYFLELWDGDKRLDAMECPFVNGISGAHPSAVERTWTIDSLYEEHSGFKQREFILSGRSGYTDLHLLRFHKFRNFLERYEQLSAENKSAFVRARDIRLTLNFPFEGESFNATLISFDYRRETQTSRASFQWSAKLLTYGYVARRWSVPAAYQKYLDSPGDNQTHTSPRHPCNRQALDVVASAPPNVKSLLQDDPRVRDVVQKCARDVPDNKHLYSLEQNRLLYRCARDAEQATWARWAASPDKERTRPAVFVVTRWYAELRMQASMALGLQFEGYGVDAELTLSEGVDFQLLATGTAGPLGFSVGLGLSSRRPPRPYVSYAPPRALPFSPKPVVSVRTSTEDCTLADVAQRECGDRQCWPELVALNGWVDARTRADGQPLGPGTPVLIPAPAGVVPPVNDDLFGTDLLLRDGDLVSVGDDIGTISGVANLSQNLDHRFRTPRGKNKTFPGFGMSTRVGSSITSDVPGTLFSDMQSQPLRDHRVARVLNVRLLEDGDKLEGTVEIETVTRDRRSASFNLSGAL